MEEILSTKQTALKITKWLMENYWRPLYQQVKNNPSLLSTIPGFLLKPDRLIFYFGQKHIGIEYQGPERIHELPQSRGSIESHVFDYSLTPCNIIDEIIGFKYEDGAIRLPLPPISTDITLPTNAGADELIRLNWNWSAQSMVLGFNVAGVFAPDGQFTRIINARFFDANPKDGLRTRHIKWLDLIPCLYDDSGEEADSFTIWTEPYLKLAELDAYSTYSIPDDFRIDKLQKINRLVEFIGNKNNDEPDITRLLASDQFRFALKMRFSAKEIHAECLCEWQSEDNPPIKPDFFVVNPDGYADIVEFKLPEIKGNAVVGIDNRETFSASINSYISQTRVYSEYFDDPNNRKYVEEKYGFKVYKPRRHLVIGRRWHFDNQTWRSIASDFNQLTIHSYDDIIDGIVVQFYN